jgi:hypothetical protein
MAVDSKSVYWVTADGAAPFEPGGTVWRVDKCGGTPELVDRGQYFPRAIVASQLGVFWTTLGTTIDGTYQKDGAIHRYDGRVSLEIADHLDGPGALDHDTERLLFATRQAIVSLTLATGTITEVAAGDQPFGVALAPPWAYWTTTQGTLEASHLFDGSPARVIASGGIDWRGIAVDDTAVYWVEFGNRHAGGPVDPAILRAPRDAGQPTLLKLLAAGTNDLKMDDTSLYFVDGALMRMSKDGSGLAAVAFVGNDSFAIDDTYAYFISGNQISKARKRPRLDAGR